MGARFAMEPVHVAIELILVELGKSCFKMSASACAYPFAHGQL